MTTENAFKAPYFFEQVRLVPLLIAAIAALVSKMVIKTELVPEQLYWLSDAGILAAMAAASATPSINARPKRPLTRVLVFAMFVAFCAVVAIRANLTEEIEVNRENHRYLVGFHLTEVGNTMERNCMVATNTQNLPHLPRHELIKCAGQAYIPNIYVLAIT
ncbi:MAG: hypothetical protein WCA20_20460 [Candidatus Sulfotelmatobacter sp.]